MLRVNFNELRRRHDLESLVLPDLEQMLIAADEVIRSTGRRALQDSVVCDVLGDDVDALFWMDVLREPGYLIERLSNLFFRPAELWTAQHPRYLFEDGVGYCEPNLTILSHFQNAPGIA